jgi:hypothetical protein
MLGNKVSKCRGRSGAKSGFPSRSLFIDPRSRGVKEPFPEGFEFYFLINV